MIEETKAKKPKIQESEMQKLDQQFEKIDQNIKELAQDRSNLAPRLETESQTKLSQSQIEKSKEIHLRPERSIGSAQKFNEKFRDKLNFDREYVQFIAANNETKDTIEIWTRPYGGMPAEFWKVPVNVPIWGPRYLAEQIKRKFYHRLIMIDRPTNSSDDMQYYGAMTVDTPIQRLDAHPISSRKSIFMGANS